MAPLWTPLPLLFSSYCQPRKEDYTKITCCQVTQTESPVGKILLGKFFKSDQEGEDQATDNGDPLSALKRKRTKESQVDQQSENPIQNEMPCFISPGNLVDCLEDAKVSRICQDNNENYEKREENGEPLHKKIETP